MNAFKSVKHKSPMKGKQKKNMVITRKEHDAWHKKNSEYDGKMDKDHEICHRKAGIKVIDG